VHGTTRRSAVYIALLLTVAAASCGSTNATSTKATSGPCSWLSEEEVEAAIGTDVSAGSYDAAVDLCTYEFTSRTGISTDLVVGPLSDAPGSILSARYQRVSVAGIGDRAAFFRAKTLRDGNSVMLVTKDDLTFIIGSEFLTLAAAKQLGGLVLEAAT
jgi:hypothetical protein